MPHRHHVGGLPVIRPFPVYFVIFAGFFGYSLLITVFTPMLLQDGGGSLLPAAVTLPTCTLARGILLFLYPAGQFFGSRGEGASGRIRCDRHPGRVTAPGNVRTALSRAPNLARAKIGSANPGSGRSSRAPRLESFHSEGAKRATGCEMALDVEGVLDGGVNGQEALS